MNTTDAHDETAMPVQPLWSVEQTARSLTAERRTVQFWAKSGRLPGAFRLGTGHRAPWAIPRARDQFQAAAHQPQDRPAATTAGRWAIEGQVMSDVTIGTTEDGAEPDEAPQVAVCIAPIRYTPTV